MYFITILSFSLANFFSFRIFSFEILNKKKLAEEKLDIMIKYINNKNKCRSQNILKHFNEEVYEICNICDNCIAQKKKI